MDDLPGQIYTDGPTTRYSVPPFRLVILGSFGDREWNTGEPRVEDPVVIEVGLPEVKTVLGNHEPDIPEHCKYVR